MAFSNTVVQQAWNRAGGQCECRRKTHNHRYVRCNKQLVLSNRGRNNGRGAWEAHHKHSVGNGGGDSVSNCEILCWSCHSQTW